MFIASKRPTDLAKEIFWLAWNACSNPRGMGVLQDYPTSSKEDVWDNIVNAGDYPGKPRKSDKLHADYVFGRMMKFYLEVKADGVEVPDRELRSDYQSWCSTYPTVQRLVDAAVENM